MNVVTKSGSNDFHGTLFEYFRNEDLDANDFFVESRESAAGKQQILRQNQFGGTFGGPIKKDKLFFFGSYQGTRQLNGVAAAGQQPRSCRPFRAATGPPLGSPPLLARRCARLTILAILIIYICQRCRRHADRLRWIEHQPCGLSISEREESRRKLLHAGVEQRRIPAAQLSIPAKYTGDQYIANVDYLINSKNTLAMRYLFTEDPQVTPFGIASMPGTPVSSYYANTDASLKLTTLISNTLINEAHASMQRNIANGHDTTPQYTPSGWHHAHRSSANPAAGNG